jgi:hypothetical protein
MFRAVSRFMKLVELFTLMPEESLIDCAASVCGRIIWLVMVLRIREKEDVTKRKTFTELGGDDPLEFRVLTVSLESSQRRMEGGVRNASRNERSVT